MSFTFDNIDEVEKFHSNNDVTINLSDTTFIKLRNTIYKLCGIYFSENKKYLLESRIFKRLEYLKIDSYEDYLVLISSINGREELTHLFDAITINETYFFRAENQLVAFEKIIIPEIIKYNRDKKSIRIWSAASSTGEEAYSIAIIIKEKLQKKYPNIKFEIFGSDISDSVIKRANYGLYSEYSIRNVPIELLGKYFQKNGEKYCLNEDIKQMVDFSIVNLYDKYSIERLECFDVIFCANVLIYFDSISKAKTVSYLYDKLNDDGYLFVGYAESLHSVSKSFELVHFPRAMAYKKEGKID